MASTAAIVGGVASAASAGNAIFGGGGSTGTYGGNPATYIPTNQPGVDQNLNDLFKSMHGPATTMPPQLVEQYQKLYGNVGDYTPASTSTGMGPITMSGYGAANPDVQQSWDQLHGGTADPAAMAWFNSLPADARTSPDAFAQWHFNTFGGAENRQSGQSPVTTTTPASGNPYAQGQQDWAGRVAQQGQQQNALNLGLQQPLIDAARGQYDFARGLQPDLVQRGREQFDFASRLQPGLVQAGQNQYDFARGLQPDLVQRGRDQYGRSTGLQDQLAPGIGGLMQAGQQAYQTGFDPQNALYDRTAHQLTEQQNAINAMYGLGSSAQGASLVGDRMANFNIDWQNNQQQRQLAGLQGLTSATGAAGGLGSTINSIGGTGLQGLGNAYSGATGIGNTGLQGMGNAYSGATSMGATGLQGLGNSYTGASNMGSTGLQNMGRSFTGAADLGNLGLNQSLATGGMPYSTYMGQQNDRLNFLNQYAGGTNTAFQLPQNLARLYGSYLGFGQDASRQGQYGQQQGFDQMGQIGQGLGKAVGGIGDLWGGGGGGGWQPDPAYARAGSSPFLVPPSMAATVQSMGYM